VTALATLSGWSIAAIAAFLIAPPVDGAASLGPAAGPVGALVGVTCFTALAGRRIRITCAVLPRRRFVARCAVLTGRSVYEEALWRGLVLGALLPLGRLPALLVSSALFAAAHVPRLGLRAWTHVPTGAAFGAVYLATGALESAMAAHAAYNIAVGAVLLAHEDCPFRPLVARRARS
jgi:hypothetical protein